MDVVDDDEGGRGGEITGSWGCWERAAAAVVVVYGRPG